MSPHNTREVISVLSLIVLLSLAPTARAQVGFTLPVNYTVGKNPVALAVGDFNGDGKPDLAIANSGDLNAGDNGNVSILLGNGDGTFREQTVIFVGANPASVVVGDFNHDGKLDLAVQNSGETTVSVLLGNGDGSFQPPVKYIVGHGGSPNGMAAADFNGDDNVDLAVANSADATVSILLGNSDGTFRTAENYQLDGSPVAVAVGDFNGDKETDLAIVVNRSGGSKEEFEGGLLTLAGNGDGTFRTPHETDIGGKSFWVSVGDLNGDGILDVVVASKNNVFSGLALKSFLGNGDGTFGAAQGLDPSTVPGEVLLHESPVMADFNKDGKLDLAVLVLPFSVSSPPPVVRILVGNGDGTFQAGLDLNPGINPSLLWASDLNLDKFPDLVDLTSNGSINILLNKSTAPSFTLTVTDAGTGSGIATSSSGGIVCGSSCTGNFIGGTVITLTATTSSDSTFTGWSGACSGMANCTVTMDSDQAVTATFALVADFSLNFASPSLFVNRGDKVSEQLVIGARGGFAALIALTCSVSGPSPLPTCKVSPNSVLPGGTATLVIDTGASMAQNQAAPASLRAGLVSAASLPFGTLFLGSMAGLVKRRRKIWAICALFVLSMIPAACGGSSSLGSQSFVVTVQASSGTLQHSSSITVAEQ